MTLAAPRDGYGSALLKLAKNPKIIAMHILYLGKNTKSTPELLSHFPNTPRKLLDEKSQKTSSFTSRPKALCCSLINVFPLWTSTC